jgi:anti-sigma factor RsiW
MCPEHQLLSVYADGELPSPWKEKMESHVAECPVCGKRLEQYRLLFAGEKAGTEAMEQAKARVWRNIEAGAGSARSAREKAPVWRRNVAVPLPLAAAAAALVLFALGALWLQRPEPGDTVIAADPEIETPGIIPVSDMRGVLQYLGSNDSGDFLILRLPESRNFMSAGEPMILKAADYNTRSVPQR